jgi:hypothetical protein
MRGGITPFPNAPSWHVAVLSTGTTLFYLTFTLEGILVKQSGEV